MKVMKYWDFLMLPEALLPNPPNSPKSWKLVFLSFAYIHIFSDCKDSFLVCVREEDPICE